MLGPLLLLLAPLVQEPGAPPPFELALPDGYGPFRAAEGMPEWWIARHDSGAAAFTVRHQLLAAPGALAERLASERRRDYWRPALAEREGEVEAWRGRIGGEEAAGNTVRVVLEDGPRSIQERFLVHLDHLVALTWEGPEEGLAEAERILDAFRPPPAWVPPPLDFDPGRGGGPEPLPSIGRFEILFDAASAEEEEVRIRLDFTAAPWLAERPRLRWRVPGREEPVVLDLDHGCCRLEYSLPHHSDPHAAVTFGLAMDRSALAATRVAGWLAAPLLEELERQPDRPVEPPAWRLEALVPAHLGALSAAPPEREQLLAEENARRIVFPEVAAGRGWPFVLMAAWRHEEIAGLDFARRTGAKARDVDGPVRFLARAAAELGRSLPAAAAGPVWSVTSFAGTGDRVLPGLLVLDEERGWLQQPVDSAWGPAGGTRRRGLAELAAGRAFGLRLRGRGSAAPFLEASLTAYLARRILADLGHADEAEALLAAWRAHDQAAGELPAPLSLLPREDLFGAQRLLGRGPLVWLAIERRAGRDRLDAVLNGFLKAGGFWTTEELRRALEERTGESWEAFFRDHVYGRRPPPAGD